jgi:hypothetical protein
LDFDEFFGPMQAYLEDFKIESYELIHAYRAPARINWKHAVDGGLENYHTPFLSRPRICWKTARVAVERLSV